MSYHRQRKLNHVRISILTPARDEGLHIQDMVRSVVSQTYDDWELIIVNDRSSDDTVAQAMSVDDPRVTVIDDPSICGKNAAFNRAWSESTGDLIAFFGADDLMPPDALGLRAESMADVDPSSEYAVSFAKVRTFSKDRRYDGIVAPRGARGNRSGGSTTITRALASLIFPIPEDLPNEDTWTHAIAQLAATREIEVPEVVVNYRIHEGNSNRRGRSFEETSAALGRRFRAYDLLLREERFDWDPEAQHWLEERAKLEEFRSRGQTYRLIAARGTPLSQRLRLAAQSSAALHGVRQVGFRVFSGW